MILEAFLLVTLIGYFLLDIPIALWCRKLDRSVLDIAEIVTTLGKSTGYLIATFLLFLFFRFFRKEKLYANQSLFVFVSIACSGIVVDIIKWVAGRYRPVMLFDQGLYGFSFFKAGYEWNSFPSGHAATVFSLAFALSLLFPKGRYYFITAAIVAAASRVLLTSHFLSDVVIGAYVGIASVYLLKYVFERKSVMLGKSG